MPSAPSDRIEVGIKDPVKLYAEPIGVEGNRWALTAVDADGSRVTIIASADRFRDALSPRGFSGVMSEAEQVREMFVRGEVDVLVLEKAVERDLSR